MNIKKWIWTLPLVICTIAIGSNLWAMPLSIEVGDKIIFNDGAGDPGVIAGVGRGGAYDASSPDTNWYSFMTFCLEVDEQLAFGYTYHVGGITTIAQRGGRNTDDGDYLDPFTAWIYTQAINGVYANQYLDKVQYAIWYSEEEITESLLNSVGAKAFYDTQYNAYLTAVDNAQWSGLGSVRVLNIERKYYDGTYGYRQDVLASVAVPEPGPVLLLGIGLIGIAGFGRNRVIKK